MPLPPNNTVWPPTQLANIMPTMDKWSAWYDGSPEALRDAYAGGAGNFNAADAKVAQQRLQQHRGGTLLGRLRYWWGRPYQDLTQQQRDMVHVPIAADMAQASADLLFADKPTFRAVSVATQDRLDELANDGLYSSFAECAEIAAALGGGYLRVTWDKNLDPTGPFTTVLHADTAWPEFQWGRLRAVTFWQVIEDDGQTVWRHLERHELDSHGIGIILHGLYQGTRTNLGRTVPLNDKPATAVFIDALNENGVISTESPGLAVRYIPNQRPQRRWRKDPVGMNLGRSDYDGVEPLMDALDEVYASWMRDIRLGKARLVVPKSLLDNLGPGNGSAFNADQEIYTPLNALAAADANGLPMEQVQFAIRWTEHQNSAQQLVDDILRTAGYSTQTFGEGDTGTIRTATEVEQRERRSLMTRDRKIRLWVPELSEYLGKFLAVDVALFAGKYPVETPDVIFNDGVQETQLTLAQTALALFQSESASTETRVALLHPDWEDDDIQDEVTKINAEKPAVPAPFSGGDDLTGMTPSEGATATAEDDPTGSQQ